MTSRSAVLPVVMYFPAPYAAEETRQYQLSQHLAAHRPVLSLCHNSAPTERIRPMSRISEVRSEGAVLLVDQQQTIGFHRLRRQALAAACYLVDRELAQFMKRLGIKRYWTYTFGAFPELMRRRRHVLRACEVADPPFVSPERTEREWTAIAATAGRADAVVCTATELKDQLSARGVPAVELIPNAASRQLITGHQGSSRRARTALYVGTLDWRVDADLLVDVARLLPDVRFVIAGRVNLDRSDDRRRIDRETNIDVLGPVDEAAKIRLLRATGVGLVPFKSGSLSDGVNPTKVYEYAAYGLPIVATDSRACRELSPPVRTASSASDFAKAITSALAAEAPSEESVAFARRNTWERRAGQLHELLLDHEVDRA